MDRYRLMLFLLLLVLTGCGTIKEIPVETVEKVVVRDSIITRVDTVVIEIEKERFKEVLPEIDTSILENTFSRSTAFLDTLQRQIHHTLDNKPQKIEKEIEIQEKIVTKTEYRKIEVPVEVPKPYVPDWCWWLLVLNGVVIAFKVGRKFLLR